MNSPPFAARSRFIHVFAGLAVVGLAILSGSCDSDAVSPEEQPSTYEEREVELTLPEGVSVDSATVRWGRQKLADATFESDSSKFVFQFQNPQDLAGDTLWLSVWGCGFELERISYVKRDGRTTSLAHEKNELVLALVPVLDSVMGKDSSKDLSKVVVDVFASSVIDGREGFDQWWESLPENISRPSLDSAIVRLAGDRGLSADALVDSGLVDLAEKDVETMVAGWVESGAVTSTWASAFIDGVQPDTTGPVILGIRPSKGDASVSWDVSSFEIRVGVTDDSLLDTVWIGDEIVKAADSVFIRSVPLEVGRNIVVVRAKDAHGNVSVDTLYVTRMSDDQGPSIKRMAPSEDTTVASTVGSVVVSWNVTDPSGIECVLIGNDTVKGDGNVYSREVSLGEGVSTIVIRARDRAGASSTDTIRVCRTAVGDTARPVVKRMTPSGADTTVGFLSRSLRLSWAVSDDSLAKVLLDGEELKAVDGLYSSVVAPGVGKNTYRLVALDAKGNTTRDSVMVVRQGDVKVPTLERVSPKIDIVVPSTIATLSVSWKVSDDALASVVIGGKGVTGDKDVFERTITLGDTLEMVVIEAKDSTGNVAHDTIRVERLFSPTILPSSGAVNNAFHAKCRAQSGATVEWSEDGSTWSPWNDSIPVSATRRILARARMGGAVSVTTSGAWVYPPKVTPSSTTFTVPEKVVVEGASGDTLEYSLDGTTWTLFKDSLRIAKSDTLFARARHFGLTSSQVSAIFKYVPLIVTPAGGGFSTTQMVSLTAATGTALEYRLGATGNWIPYKDPFSVGGCARVQARVVGTGIVANADFAFPPKMTLEDGDYPVLNDPNDSVKVSAPSADSIEYSENGGPWLRLKSKYWFNTSVVVSFRARCGSAVSPVVKRNLRRSVLRAFSGVGNEWSHGALFSPSSPAVFWMKDDSLWATGDNLSLYGNGTTTSSNDRVFLGTGFERVWVSSGSNRQTGESSYFLRKGGELLGSGSNMAYELGQGHGNQIDAMTHIMDGVRTVSTAPGITLVVTLGGELWAMGNITKDVIGSTESVWDYAKYQIPARVTLPAAMASPVKDAVASYDRSIVLLENGELWGAGSNWWGHLGLGDSSGVFGWTKIMTGVRTIAGNSFFLWAVRNDNTLWGFGDNAYGPLASLDAKVLVPTKFFSNVDTIAVGERHGLILDRKGDVYAVGAGGWGALGTGSKTDVSTPELVASSASWISAGGVVSFVRSRSGQFYGCGANYVSSGTPVFPGYTGAVLTSWLTMMW